jgi:hypothetical protein
MQTSQGTHKSDSHAATEQADNESIRWYVGMHAHNIRNMQKQ